MGNGAEASSIWDVLFKSTLAPHPELFLIILIITYSWSKTPQVKHPLGYSWYAPK